MHISYLMTCLGVWIGFGTLLAFFFFFLSVFNKLENVSGSVKTCVRLRDYRNMLNFGDSR